MAKNNNVNKKKISSFFKKPSKPNSSQPARTEVRNSPVPKVTSPSPIAKAAAAATPAPKIITHEMIAVRAYEISQSPACGSEYDNWIRAERELRGS